jgi:hypothetical protein
MGLVSEALDIIKNWDKITSIGKGIFVWAWNHKERALIIILAIALAISSKCSSDYKKKMEETNVSAEDLKSKHNGKVLELNAKLTLLNGRLTIAYRENGELKSKSMFVPVEGGIVNETFKNPNDKVSSGFSLFSGFDWAKDFFTGTRVNVDGGTVLIRDRGFTFKPGLGIFYDGRYNNDLFAPAVDFKLVYFKRYGIGLGTTIHSPYIWVSRHVDDFTFDIVNNMELTLGYGSPYDSFGKNLLLIGLRTNL